MTDRPDEGAVGDGAGDIAPPVLAQLEVCFEGAIPAVIATAAADGTPNVTYLSRVRLVDDHHVALSNQFFSKTSRNLVENPRASLLVIDPTTYEQYRLALVYERTERRGPVFEQLRDDVDAVAALEGMQDVFKLRAADIYRVTHIEQVLAAVHRQAPSEPPCEPDDREPRRGTAQLAELSGRLGRCSDLDILVDTATAGLAELFGFEHSLLLLLDEGGSRLFTIASHGYETEGVGSEVTIGEGIIGMAAARSAPIRVGNLRHMRRYSRSVRQSFEDEGTIGPGREIPIPGLADAESRIAVPLLALGQLIGVLTVESAERVAYTADDEALLTVVASLVSNAIEIARESERSEEAGTTVATETHLANASRPTTLVRYFPVDGTTFLDGDYLIKGVAGRILWSLLNHYERDGRDEFTNREVRLDPSLELPEFRDNLEGRLILLKRRLHEREAPIQIEKTGRGRFRLVVDTTLRLEAPGD